MFSNLGRLFRRQRPCAPLVDASRFGDGDALSLAFSDQAIVLNLGEIVLREAPDVLRQDGRLVETYLTR